MIQVNNARKTKEKTFTIRIDQETIEQMNIFTKIFKISKSELARKSIKTYMLLNFENRESPNPKLFFSKNMLKPLLDFASESEIEEVAEISFQNGIADAKYFSKFFSKDEIPENLDVEAWVINPDADLSALEIEKRIELADSQLNSLISVVLAPGGQNWLDSIEFFRRGKNFVIQGKHQLGNNFSLFLRYLLQKYLIRFGYEITTEDFMEIKTHSRKKNQTDTKQITYSLTLVFSPKNKNKSNQ